MLAALRHAARFARVLWVLKRHGAWFAVRRLGPLPWPARLLVSLAALPAPGRDDEADEGKRLVAALHALGPAYVKLGQTLATRPDIVGPGLAVELGALQDRLPPFSGEAARKVIEEDLGQPVDSLFPRFDDRAVAAASIAQVHKARTADGRDVAVKVARPGIRTQFARDLDAFAWAAKWAERLSPEARRLRATDVVETLREGVERELDLRLEAAAASELRETMLGEPHYRVPEIDWHRTARRVMTMEWIDGTPLSDMATLDARGHDRHALAERVVQIFLKQAMRDGYFHADLHQGNFLVEADGTLVALDFGIMGRLDRESALYLAEILWAFQERDYMRAAKSHFKAGYVPGDRSVADFAMALRAIAEPVHDRPVEEISAGDMLAQLFATTAAFDMETQPQLLMLQRSMVMVEGLASTLDPRVNLWASSRPVIESWIRDQYGLEAQAADTLIEAGRSIGRLPDLARAGARLLERAERDGLPIDPRSLAALKGPDRPHPMTAGVIGALVGALIVLLLG
ncbi:2-polyprenylphenol 6-hydroxylase [Rhodothalassium salexigens]|uniref:2-polyprenylphenol 6-hydroxylase n=1 Tax=Rhodothalassium salexigens TaxID=1086 RepID=UPI0019136BC6|nr:2-polyprenylphenol 6-hydroxylase [Rhodothalassium salexigens]MBK5912143.1 2-polyprenylphenol 6-hydroxylase [Rhodothalassium salexigens]MBK5921823.1 2-polyprenylphenol 6-hydroxylase [Rhodothalassium salexigens]